MNFPTRRVAGESSSGLRSVHVVRSLGFCDVGVKKLATALSAQLSASWAVYNGRFKGELGRTRNGGLGLAFQWRRRDAAIVSILLGRVALLSQERSGGSPRGRHDAQFRGRKMSKFASSSTGEPGRLFARRFHGWRTGCLENASGDAKACDLAIFHSSVDRTTYLI